MSDFHLDLRQFQSALREYQRATDKDVADILNRTGRNVALRAIKLTPKATAAKIKADLARNRNAIWATIRRLRKASVSQRGMSRTQFAKEVKKTIGIRARSAGYVASGWLPAAAAFGAKVGSRKPGGNAAKGSGKLATERDAVAVLINAATGAGKIGADALQGAVDFVAKDMLDYANKKLSATARKFSAR